MRRHRLTRSMTARSRRAAAGQSIVEFAIVLPLLLLLLLAMLEFGFAFEHDQTLAYATREGARTGAALGGGAGQTVYPCTTADFDAPIIAATERVLTSQGSPIDLSRVSSITVYLARADGSPTAGMTNVWSPAPGAGPVVDGKALDFKQTTANWTPCSRNNGANADGLGVSISYTYQFQTSFGGIFRLMFGQSWSSLAMSDKTVMRLNPTN